MDERSERIAKRLERALLVAAVLTIPVTILQLLPPGDPRRTIADDRGGSGRQAASPTYRDC
jgi:hypothetical protein